jgi:hypothetical protein
MLTTAELQALAKQTAQIVRSATEPLLARIAELEGRQPQKGEKGDPGPGPDEAVIRAAVEAHVRQIQPIPGPKGDPGEVGQKGADGRDGADAEVDYDALAKCVDEGIARKSAEFQLVLERTFNEVLRGFDVRVADAIKALPVPKDGQNGKDGRDGLGFEDVEFQYDGARTVTAKFVRGGSVLKEVPWKFPVIIDKGYWKEGAKAEAGDAMTEGGTLYIALRDTAEKPSTGAKDWRIGARKGRDGNPPTVKINA